ncbi:trimeric LpxA-like protein [Delphinella strobiligena]|nr:trimeric LpxA-like protein [Delphinella strobiligena]
MATNSSTTSRRQPSSSAVPSRTKDSLAPKPPCSIHPSAIISDKAIITGTHPVTIGEGCVVHPFAKITSAVAPVRIGNNSIIAERTTVGLIAESSASEDAAVTLEDNVSIESGAVVEAVRVGTGSVVEVNARLGPRATVGKFCKISSLCNVFDELPDYTIVFGEGSRRIDATVKARSDVRDLKIKGHMMHIETLKRLVPSNTSKWIS